MDNSTDIPTLLDEFHDDDFYVMDDRKEEFPQHPATGTAVTRNENGQQQKTNIFLSMEHYQDLSFFSNQQLGKHQNTTMVPAQVQPQTVANMTTQQQSIFDLGNNPAAQQQLAELAQMGSEADQEENVSVIEEPSNSDCEMLDSDDDDFVVPKLSRIEVAKLTNEEKYQRRKDLNRAAAAKSRRKKKDKTHSLEKELKQLAAENKKYKSLIRQYEQDKFKTITAYQEHMKTCTCPLSFLESSAPQYDGPYV